MCFQRPHSLRSGQRIRLCRQETFGWDKVSLPTQPLPCHESQNWQALSTHAVLRPSMLASSTEYMVPNECPLLSAGLYFLTLLFSHPVFVPRRSRGGGRHELRGLRVTQGRGYFFLKCRPPKQEDRKSTHEHNITTLVQARWLDCCHGGAGWGGQVIQSPVPLCQHHFRVLCPTIAGQKKTRCDTFLKKSK